MKPQNPTIPLILSFLSAILFALGIIILGYFRSNMHLFTTLKNAAEFYS